MLKVAQAELAEAQGRRGPRWFVQGSLRRGEYICSYHVSGVSADQAAEKLREEGHHGVRVLAPADLEPLADMTRSLATERRKAQAELSEATDKVRACVVRLIDNGVSKVQAAELAGVTRVTVNSWLGKP